MIPVFSVLDLTSADTDDDGADGDDGSSLGKIASSLKPDWSEKLTYNQYASKPQLYQLDENQRRELKRQQVEQQRMQQERQQLKIDALKRQLLEALDKLEEKDAGDMRKLGKESSVRVELSDSESPKRPITEEQGGEQLGGSQQRVLVEQRVMLMQQEQQLYQLHLQLELFQQKQRATQQRSSAASPKIEMCDSFGTDVESVDVDESEVNQGQSEMRTSLQAGVSVASSPFSTVGCTAITTEVTVPVSSSPSLVTRHVGRFTEQCALYFPPKVVPDIASGSGLTLHNERYTERLGPLPTDKTDCTRLFHIEQATTSYCLQMSGNCRTSLLVAADRSLTRENSMQPSTSCHGQLPTQTPFVSISTAQLPTQIPSVSISTAVIPSPSRFSQLPTPISSVSTPTVIPSPSRFSQLPTPISSDSTPTVIPSPSRFSQLPAPISSVSTPTVKPSPSRFTQLPTPISSDSTPTVIPSSTRSNTASSSRFSQLPTQISLFSTPTTV